VSALRQPGVVATKADGGRARLRGDSDAQSCVADRHPPALLLLGPLSPQILEFDAKAALTQLGLASALSAQRSNG
jgi:sulfur transfer protein SufE